MTEDVVYVKYVDGAGAGAGTDYSTDYKENRLRYYAYSVVLGFIACLICIAIIICVIIMLV